MIYNPRRILPFTNPKILNRDGSPIIFQATQFNGYLTAEQKYWLGKHFIQSSVEEKTLSVKSRVDNCVPWSYQATPGNWIIKLDEGNLIVIGRISFESIYSKHLDKDKKHTPIELEWQGEIPRCLNYKKLNTYELILLYHHFFKNKTPHLSTNELQKLTKKEIWQLFNWE